MSRMTDISENISSPCQHRYGELMFYQARKGRSSTGMEEDQTVQMAGTQLLDYGDGRDRVRDRAFRVLLTR